MLLDFGASRDYSEEFVEKYVRIIKAASDSDRETVLVGSRDIGFLTGYESKVNTCRCAQLMCVCKYRGPCVLSMSLLLSVITEKKDRGLICCFDAFDRFDHHICLQISLKNVDRPRLN